MTFASRLHKIRVQAAVAAQWHALPWAAVLLGEPIFRLLLRRPQRLPTRLEEARRILIIRLDAIGDVILTGPFLRELRRNCPTAKISLVVNPEVFSIVELCPYVDEVLTYEPRGQTRAQRAGRQLRALSFARRRLLPKRFDLAIVPRWDIDLYGAVLLAYMSGAPRRVGFSTAHAGPPYSNPPNLDLLLTDAIEDHSVAHEAECNLNLIRWLGGRVEQEGLECWLSEVDRANARRLLTENGVRTEDTLVAMVVGARESHKIWPLERFVKVGEWLIRERGARVAILGGPQDTDRGAHLRSTLGSRLIDLTGRATLREVVAVLEQCQLCLANNTGPLHLAAAAGVPVVEVSCLPIGGSPSDRMSPVRFGPWGVPTIAVQAESPLSPDQNMDQVRVWRESLESVTVEDVQRAIDELWAGEDSGFRRIATSWCSQSLSERSTTSNDAC